MLVFFLFNGCTELYPWSHSGRDLSMSWPIPPSVISFHCVCWDTLTRLVVYSLTHVLPKDSLLSLLCILPSVTVRFRSSCCSGHLKERSVLQLYFRLVNLYCPWKEILLRRSFWWPWWQPEGKPQAVRKTRKLITHQPSNADRDTKVKVIYIGYLLFEIREVPILEITWWKTIWG
jgi:hypothetical protein